MVLRTPIKATPIEADVPKPLPGGAIDCVIKSNPPVSIDIFLIAAFIRSIFPSYSSFLMSVASTNVSKSAE